MFIPDLEIYYFRNIAAARLRFSAGLSVILGKNGQGKTSLLEAIYLLSHPRSFRTANHRELCSWQKSEDRGQPPLSPTVVNANICSADGDKQVRYEIENGRRRVFINEKKIASASAFYGQVPVVEFTPDELFLVKGGAAGRRQFIDKTLSLSQNRLYIDNLVTYQRALKQRNRLLKESKGFAVDTIRRSLEPWTEILITSGKELAAARRLFVKRLAEPTIANYAALVAGQESSEELSLSYTSDFLSEGEPIDDAFLRQEFEKSFSKDLARKATSFGTHRDDLEIYLAFGDRQRWSARQAASQGQSRSIALSLKLAAISYLTEHHREQPILLLDDVESELDLERAARFFESLSRHKSQIFLTATHFSELAKERLPEAELYVVKGGEIAPLPKGK